MLGLLGAIVGAIGFRLRGSSWFEEVTGRGATTARIVCWAIPMGALSLTNVPWQYSFLVGLGFFLGAIAGWWGCLDLGRNEGSAARDYIVMFFRGILWTLPPTIVVYPFDATAGAAMLIAGALCPVAYTIGWLVPSKIPNLRQGPELGEFIFGGMIGACVVL